MPKGNKDGYVIYGTPDHSMNKTSFYSLSTFFADVMDEYPANPEKFTRSFTVMINGKRRKIITYQADENGDKLRKLHRVIAAVMRKYYKPSGNSYAYKHGSCVLDALRNHLESNTFLKTDIHSYFDSVDYDICEAKFLQLLCPSGNRKSLWVRALKACFHEGSLPIGFISSPVLSDLFLHDIDMKYGKVKGIRYTRYADDLIISGKGNNIENKLGRIHSDLEQDLKQLKLELNTKKTYIRKLMQPGDAIHLLGLNMVFRGSKTNEITVSDSFLRETSKELCSLVAQKPYIEDAEARKRFAAVMGKIDYICHSSERSTEKLKKMLFVKAGLRCDLNYKELAKLCMHDPGENHRYITARLNEMEKRITPYHVIPQNGKVWIRFVSEPENKTKDLNNEESMNRFTGIRNKVMQLCNDILEPQEFSTCLRYLRLTIKGETKKYTGEKKQAKELLDFAKRISKSDGPIDLYLHYTYTRKNVTGFAENKNHIYNPFYGQRNKASVQRTVIVSDENDKSWEFWQAKTSDPRERYDNDLLTECDESIFETHPSWKGVLSLNAYWPLSTEQEVDKKIREQIVECMGIIKEQTAYTEGIRSVKTEADLRLSGDDAEKIAKAISGLTSLISRAEGETNLSCWMIPEDFLQAEAENSFNYVQFSVSEAGRLKIRSCML